MTYYDELEQSFDRREARITFPYLAHIYRLLNLGLLPFVCPSIATSASGRNDSGLSIVTDFEVKPGEE